MNDSVEVALAWEERVRQVILDLGDFAGHAVDENASERLGYRLRKVVFERTYLIHYRVGEEAGVVRVVDFRHGAREPRRGEP